jgi:hypothetical protein
MQISFTYPTGGAGRVGFKNVFLGDDAIKEYIKGYRPRLSVSMQTVNIPRAKQKEGFGRGNSEIPVSWQTHRALASYDAAHAFINTHLLELQDNQEGTLSVVVTSISSSSVRYLNAVLVGAEVIDHAGVSVVFRYDFWCSKLTALSV